MGHHSRHQQQRQQRAAVSSLQSTPKAFSLLSGLVFSDTAHVVHSLPASTWLSLEQAQLATVLLGQAQSPLVGHRYLPKMASVAPKTSASPTKPPDPGAQTTPTKGYVTGTCTLHIFETASGGDGASLGMSAEIKDGGGNTLTSVDIKTGSLEWGATYNFHKEDSALDYDVMVTFYSKTPTKKRSLLERLTGDPPAAPTPNWGYEKRLIMVQAGENNFDTSVTEESAGRKLPYWHVGGWDRNGLPPVRIIDNTLALQIPVFH